MGNAQGLRTDQLTMRSPAKPKPQVEDHTPRSVDAESGAVSCLLLNPHELVPDFLSKYDVEDMFYYVPWRGLVKELSWMLKKGRRVDLVTLSQHLIDKDLMESIGASTIAELYNFVPTTAHYLLYCGMLADKAKLRKAKESVNRLDEILRTESYDLAQLTENVLVCTSAINAVFERKEESQSLTEQVSNWHDQWKKKSKGEAQSAMPTRWVILNKRMGGLFEGYTIISGEYSGGKSVFLRNLMVDSCITQGRPGLLANYETSIDSTISGMVCDLAGLPTPVVFRPDQNPPTASQEKSLAWALKKILGSKLKIIHEPHLSADGVCHQARIIKDKHGDVVVGVDYLQKLPRPTHIEKNAQQERELAVNSDTLQKLSKGTGIPVVVACQNNNNGTSRGSAAIEMDADICYRIEGDAGVFVVKYKEGERFFHLPLFLDKPKLRFTEREE